MIKQYSKYIPYIIIAILAILLCFKSCSDNNIPLSNNEPLKAKVKELEVKKDSVVKEVVKTDSIRIKYVTKWRLKIKDSIVYKPCEELILICDSIIVVDSTEISQLKHVNLINDSIITTQKVMLYNDSLDIRALKNKVKKRNLAILGLGVLSVGLLIK